METERLREQQAAEHPSDFRSLVPSIELTSHFWLREDALGPFAFGFAHDDESEPFRRSGD
jgi:hypothetical protein